jgi:phosphoribosylformylglycinamidine (FGAM) synthase-like enzyme
MLGATVSLKKLPGDYTSADSALFSESQGRIVVTVSKKNKTLFEKLMRGIPFANLGVVSKSKKVVVTDKKGKKIINTDIDKLKDTYHKFSDKMK